MIKKIIGVTFFISLLVALLLYSNGYTYETFQKSLYTLIRETSIKMQELESYEIPTIPNISRADFVSSSFIITAFISFAQIVVNIINFVISIINTLFYVFKFVGVLTYEIGIFVASGSTSTNLALVRL